MSPTQALDFTSLLSGQQRRRAAFQHGLDAAPRSLPCPEHPRQTAVLDVPASWEAARIVHRCEVCDLEAVELSTRQRMGAMGVPERVRGAMFAGYSTSSQPVASGITPSYALDTAARMANGELLNLVLCGTPGTGKGHLAAAIMRARLDAGASGDRWLTAASFFRAYHAAYDDGANAAVVRHYARRPLLVLDEMGLGAIPRDGEVALSELFDARWNAQRPTVIISNLTPAVLCRDWLGARVSDRLNERSAVLWMAWKSFRQ